MKILVVEESPLTRKFIINELKTDGFEIKVASTAEEALEILAEIPNIDLITLRVVMEGMDGFQFVNHLRSPEVRARLKPLHNDQIPTIFVTSNDTDADRLRGYQVGAADFIQKPWPKGDLLKHVNIALGRGLLYSGLSVLVVDDSPVARHFITACLGQLGVTIYQADDGETALDILRDPEITIDLVVTDLMMVRMNGDQLCVKIRGELGLTDLPIIFLSGNEDKTTILSLFKMGATDYLKKPFMKEELVARLRAYLDREASRQFMLTTVSQLKESNLLKDEFMTVCSQDLHSPMEGILTFTDQLAEDLAGNPDHLEKLDGIRSSGQHLLSFLANLRDIGQIASGHQPLQLVYCDWEKILDDSLAAFKHTAGPKGIKLNRSVTATSTAVQADLASLLRACNNVISNAIKFTPPGGNVSVSLADGRSGELVLVVTDTGVGLDPEKLPELFDRYHRTTSLGTKGEKGTGLGLSITRELVERQGGTMGVESAPGQGTTVKIILPQMDVRNIKSVVNDSTGNSRQKAELRAGSHILLVDDEPGHLAQGRKLLESLGCQVAVAASGMDAVKLFQGNHKGSPFDLIILDLDLPVQSGLETAQAIRRSESAETRDQVPILAMTSRSLGGQLGQFLEAGVNDFLAKPLDASSVHDALERWLPVLV